MHNSSLYITIIKLTLRAGQSKPDVPGAMNSWYAFKSDQNKIEVLEMNWWV